MHHIYTPRSLLARFVNLSALNSLATVNLIQHTRHCHTLLNLHVHIICRRSPHDVRCALNLENRLFNARLPCRQANMGCEMSLIPHDLCVNLANVYRAAFAARRICDCRPN